MTKLCTKCNVWKDESEFYKRSGRDSTMGACKSCWNARNKQWFLEHAGKATEYKRRWRERNADYARDRHFITRYNITAEQVDAMIAEQDGRCRICGLERPLVVDHDHETNLVRGMLCQ